MEEKNSREGEHEHWFVEAGRVARRALCLRAKCGAVIVRGGVIIGEGYNAPPRDDVLSARCSFDAYDRARKPKYDLTCCVHAEWRAIMDMLRRGEDPRGSVLYYARLSDGGALKYSGEPFCTVCSRLASDVGIGHFALRHEHGATLYDAKDYNDRSYAFHEKDSGG
jgi:deoxycytidylate deaminase